MSLVTGLFFPVLLLNQRWSPPLRLQASHCSTFRIVCDVPSIAVFYSESIECFLGISSRFFLKLLVTIPVAPIITGTFQVPHSFYLYTRTLLFYLFFRFIIIIIIIIIIIVVTKGIRWNIVGKKYLRLDNSLISITEWSGIMDIKTWKEKKFYVNYLNNWDLDRPMYQNIHLKFFHKNGG